MKQIADFMRRVIIDKEPREKVRDDVIELRRGFRRMHYAFDSRRDAYEYIRVR